MLNSDVVRAVVAKLREPGWHYERELLTAVHAYQVGEVVETLQVLLIAGCIRGAGDEEQRRYKWVGK